MSDNSYYIVRGAKMRCSCGSHTRRINLPVSHGSYVGDEAKMNKEDCVADDNISYFGVCTGACPDSEIYLVGEDGKTVSGKKCTYMNYDSWQNCKEDSLVDGKEALTTDSYLVCAYGGIIQFISTGQEEVLIIFYL